MVVHAISRAQAKTALAETPGSKFVEECGVLLQAANFEGYLDKMLQHLDMVFSTCSDKGELELFSTLR